ncbi:MAG: DUF190 domain-containing protein [Thermoleophilia bacterium]
MSGSLKLVAHFGEGDRVEGRSASDALMDLVAASGVAGAVLLRGVEGFGLSSRLRTDRLLSLSDDLPLVAVAVGAAGPVAALARRAAALLPGLVTLERVAVPDLGGERDSPAALGGRHAKVSLLCGRGEPAARGAVAAMRGAGLSGALALVGVDGTMRGERRRARVLARNEGVPCLVQGYGPAERVPDLLPRLRALAGRHVIVVERVHVVRRDGAAVGDLPAVPSEDPGGMGLWQRVSVACGEDARWEGRPLYERLIRRLREEGAAGATALRGGWGYTGDGRGHGDHLLSLRRRAPVIVSIIDRPEAIRRLWPVVAAATAATGLVTCETVPAAQARAPGGSSSGGLGLSRPPA